MQVIYVESAIETHPQTQAILARYPQKEVVLCHHYGEIFNRSKQHFRQQKQAPALILAEKKGKKVLSTPEGFGISTSRNYYFSHLLNCPFDCRYCFLQGMYNSAHHVLFINYDDFKQEIAHTIAADDTPCTFFSGYDADSLALEPVTGFIASFLPFFSQYPQATLELRTKSANVNALLSQPAISNCVVAFSFTPQRISSQVEHGVPSIAKRLDSITKLVDAGYQIGLRFDPIVDSQHFSDDYQQLFDAVFARIPPSSLHSVSTGVLRYPEKMHQKITKLYPTDPLLLQTASKQAGIISYDSERVSAMENEVHALLQRYVSRDIIFSCHQ